MRFLVRKRRQPPAIIIVALIDILIVLLIFVLATSTFRQQPAVKLALPESSQAQKTGANEDAPLLVTIDKEGIMRFGPEGRLVTVEKLREELKAATAARAGVRVAISADKNAPWGQVIKVMDAAKEAQVGSVSALIKEAARP